MKSMKYILAAVILLAGSGLFIYSKMPENKAAPPTTEVAYYAHAMRLSDLGFNNVQEVAEKMATVEKKKWAALGFVYYSDAEFRAVLARNKLVNFTPSQYTGEIPTDKQAEILANLDKILANGVEIYADKAAEGHMFFVGEGTLTWRTGATIDELSGMEPSKDQTRIVSIAAPREEGIDPIVTVKIKGGRIQLARW